MKCNENKVREILLKVAPQVTETNHTIKIDLLTEDLYFDNVDEFVDRVTEELRILVISNSYSFDEAIISSHHGEKVITEDGVVEKAKNVSISLKYNDEDITVDIERFIDKLSQFMSMYGIESKNIKAEWVSNYLSSCRCMESNLKT